MFWLGVAIGLAVGIVAGAGGLAWYAISADRRRP